MDNTEKPKKTRKAPEQRYPKTREIWFLGLTLSLLSRRVWRGTGWVSGPPIEFGEDVTWADVFKLCYEMLGDDRPELQYANTIKFSRDQGDRMWTPRLSPNAILRAGWNQNGTELGREVLLEMLPMKRAAIMAEIWSLMDDVERVRFPLVGVDSVEEDPRTAVWAEEEKADPEPELNPEPNIVVVEKTLDGLMWRTPKSDQSSPFAVCELVEHDVLICWGRQGQLFTIPVSHLPESRDEAKHYRKVFTNIPRKESILQMMSLRQLESQSGRVVVVTRAGHVKLLDMDTDIGYLNSALPRHLFYTRTADSEVFCILPPPRNSKVLLINQQGLMSADVLLISRDGRTAQYCALRASGRFSELATSLLPEGDTVEHACLVAPWLTTEELLHQEEQDEQEPTPKTPSAESLKRLEDLRRDLETLDKKEAQC